MEKEKIVFVIHRYGEEVNGGAEYECRVLAEHLTVLYDVDVLTSCAKVYDPWDNYYKVGRKIIKGVKVIRFPVERKKNTERLTWLAAEINRGHTERRKKAMADENNIQLTDDPLTNIHIMVPMLNDEQRKAMSYLMYGCFIGGKVREDAKSNQARNK